jgi:23S rRNA pseudouridine1911/1915/1917 synthase
MADQVELEVPASLDGARVDKAIADLFEVSRATAAHVVEAGVLLDGSAATGSDRVKGGQMITCQTPDESFHLAPEEMDISVLHEDDQVIVVDKPAGVVVHPGSGRTRGTLAAGLIFRYPELEGVGAEERWGSSIGSTRTRQARSSLPGRRTRSTR